MKIAFSTLGCPGWSWDEIFATAKDLGLDGIEVRGVENQMFAPAIKAFSDATLAQTQARLQKAGMEIPILTTGACLGTPSDSAAYMKEAQETIDFASRIGVPFVRVMISGVPEPTDSEDVIKAKTNYLSLCDYAKGKQVCVLIETNGKLANSKVMREFMDGVDPACGGVLWDVHHPYRYYSESPAQTYENIGEWVRYLHVKDSVVQGEKIVYRMMGYGDVPIFDTLKLLTENGYDGFVTLEWVKRWCPDLQEPGIVFAHFANYMSFLKNQLK